MRFLSELRRRNVIRMAGLYLVGAWLITQVAGTVLPMFGAPDWVARTIVMVLAIGFIPALAFAWIFELTAEGLKRDEDVVPRHSIAPQTARRMDRMLMLVSVLALGYFAFDKVVLAPRRDVALVAQATEDVTAAAKQEQSRVNPYSIAVLPFVNMSGEKDNEYFSDGISEEILNVLAQVPKLQVAARTSSFSFKGVDREVPQIARELGVRMVLEGSVRKQGERVRITAQLIDASNGFHVWSQTYDRELKDIFAIQDEIAKAIAGELKVKLEGATRSGRNASGTSNVAAYDLYLRGMALWHGRGGDNLWKAIALFKQAVAADPGFAPAYAGQALAYSIVPAYSDRMGWAEALDLAEDNGLRALAMDPEVPETYAALGTVASVRLHREAAVALMRRAIILRPSFATAHHWLGNGLQGLGNLTGALKEYDRATALDPRSPVIGDNHAFALIAAGRNTDARKRCEQVLAFAPRHYACLQYIAVVDLIARNWGGAQAMLEGMVAINNPSAHAQGRELVDALSGRNDKHALAVRMAALPFNSNVDQASGNGLEDQIVVMMLMLLEEPALALDYFERNAENLGTTMDWAHVLPQLDPIRCEPRFVAVVKKLKTNDRRHAELCRGKS